MESQNGFGLGGTPKIIPWAGGWFNHDLITFHYPRLSLGKMGPAQGTLKCLGEVAVAGGEVWCGSHKTWIILSERWHFPALSVPGLSWPETSTVRKWKRKCKALSVKVWNPKQIPILSCKNRRFLFLALQTTESHKSPRRELIPP